MRVGFLVAVLFALVSVGAVPARAGEDAGFAGSGSCAGCHEAETKAWSQSDHAWALREPTPQSVLGDFSDVRFTNKGVTSRFFSKDGGYFVETDGPDGKLATYKVRYTVGVRPLQQYLVETEGGRLQVLDIDWDVNARHWYHLYPDQDVAAGNGLHWTGTYKNWQARCADCHQTGFDKGFDLQSKTYASHWSDLTVTCESCHGPGAGHVAAARSAAQSGAKATLPQMIALGVGQQENELKVCGPCHARREAFSQKSAPVGAMIEDHYKLSLLTDGLYFADGQQRDEVFILGSFLQSKMMSKGVTCSNCHEPHTGQLVAEGNAVCTQCHSPAGNSGFPTLAHKLYDGPEHHRHAVGSEGAQCVSCHMPERAYMVIDKRRDHFFRRPDPQQSKAAGAPDACTACHNDKSQDWAAGQIAGWFPDADHGWQDRAAFTAYHGGDRSADVIGKLAAYARDLDRPAIVRATAADLVAEAGDPATRQRLAVLLRDKSPLVRAAAVPLLREADPATKLVLLRTLLADPSRDVRQAAATELAGVDLTTLPPADQESLRKAIGEYVESRAANADMPEAHMALGGLALSMRRWPSAEAAFRQATALDPQLDSAWVMTARLNAALGEDAKAVASLDEGHRQAPRSIPIMLERADLEARRGQDRDAMEWYRRALAVDPNRADILLGLASAALRSNDPAAGIDAAGKAIALQPGNADAFVLSAFGHFMTGDKAKATDQAREARRLSPAIQLPAELDSLLAP